MLNITDIKTKETDSNKEKPFCYMTVYLQIKIKNNPKPASARIYMDVHAPENIPGILNDLPDKITTTYQNMYKDKIESIDFITAETYQKLKQDQKSQVRIDFEDEKVTIAAKDTEHEPIYDVENMNRLLTGVVSYETEDPDGIENLMAMGFDFEDMLSFGVSKEYIRNFLEDLSEEEIKRYCPDEDILQNVLNCD